MIQVEAAMFATEAFLLPKRPGIEELDDLWEKVGLPKGQMCLLPFL